MGQRPERGPPSRPCRPSGGQTATLSNIDTLVGSAGNDGVTLGASTTSAIVNLLGGDDTLTLANGTNTLSAFNVETLTGGTGSDNVTLGGAAGQTVSAGGIETLTGSANADTLTMTSGNNLVIGSTGADTIALQSGAGTDSVGYTSQLEGGAFGTNSGFDSVTNFQSGTDKLQVVSNSTLVTAVDKNGDSSLALTSRASGAVNLSSDEVVYLTTAVSSGNLASSNFSDFLTALGSVSGTGPALVVANDGTNSGLYYLNDFGSGSVSASNVRMLGLFNSVTLQTTDITLP